MHDSDLSVPGYRQSLSEATLVAREYASLERLALRRLDRTGWLRFDGPDEEELLLAAVSEVRPTRVLDVGCGDGRLAAQIAAPEVVCVEPSDEELPFPDGSFDVVICNQVLHDLSHADRVVAEFARVLRPGGRFAGIYDTPGHLRELLGELEESFDSESGLPVLQVHFAAVARRYCRGAILWLTQRELQADLDSVAEIHAQVRAPDGPYPFTATREKCVFVADAP